MNGKNGLACITPVSEVVSRGKLVVRPLPGLPVVRDLVVDMGVFYKQYQRIKPYLQNVTPAGGRSVSSRQKTEQSLMGYMSVSCARVAQPVARHSGGILKVYWAFGLVTGVSISGSTRDEATEERLADLDDPFSVFRCRGIMNCVSVCRKA